MYKEEIRVRSLPLRGLCALDVFEQCNGKLAEAAEQLNITVPGLSMQIGRLEADLGFDVIQPVVSGGRRGFVLTHAGASLVSALRAAMPALEGLAETAKLMAAECGAVAMHEAASDTDRGS